MDSKVKASGQKIVLTKNEGFSCTKKCPVVAFSIFHTFLYNVFPEKLQANIREIKSVVTHVLAQPLPSDLVKKVFNIITWFCYLEISISLLLKKIHCHQIPIQTVNLGPTGRFDPKCNAWRYLFAYCGLIKVPQRSNAKMQHHFRFSPPRTLQEFEKKTCETYVGKCYKSTTVRENYQLGVWGCSLVNSLVRC